MKQTTIVRSFGRVVRTSREERGLTRPQFAQRCGLPSTYLRQLERGYVDPSFSALAALARALEMDPDELLAEVVAFQRGASRPMLTLGQLQQIRNVIDNLRDCLRLLVAELQRLSSGRAKPQRRTRDHNPA